jgi:pantetheine-phosphate adenylyltransferase
MARKALYPGSFDPVTFGHLDVIKRATAIFDEVVVAVANNSQKNPLFSVEERVSMLKAATKGIQRLKIVSFDGLVIDFARKNKIHVIIRGLRMLSDFEFEFQMALTNRRLNEKIETIFLMPSEKYSFISSKLLKEAASLGADTSSFVPGFVAKALKERFK